MIVTDGCSPNPCKNGGICLGTVDQYKCKCVDGFVGKNCESKFPVILYNVKDVKVKEDLQNNFISTDKVKRINAHNDQFSPVTCRLF